jgi:FkbH-like protein
MSEKDVLKISNNKDYLTISANLEDKFGDNGIVTILIAEIKKRRLEIKSWLMSCRVFNRNLEIALFDQLIILCKKKGIENIHGSFIPGDKNNIVKNFYASLNFKKNGKNKWKFKVEKKYKKQEKIIKVINEIK